MIFFNLKPPTVPGSPATIKIETKKKEILQKIHRASFSVRQWKIFESICPNFLDDPKQAYGSIKQVNEDGHILTVSQYYSVAMTLLSNFKKGKAGICMNNPTAHWVKLLHKPIWEKMEEGGYKTHLGGALVRPYDQLTILTYAYKQAVIAKLNINNAKEMIASKLKTLMDCPYLLPPQRSNQQQKKPSNIIVKNSTQMLWMQLNWAFVDEIENQESDSLSPQRQQGGSRERKA